MIDGYGRGDHRAVVSKMERVEWVQFMHTLKSAVNKWVNRRKED